MMSKNKKIGIVSWHYYSNFGSALQSYALQEAIIGLGMSNVEFVNYQNPKYVKPSKLKNILILALSYTLGLFSDKFSSGRLLFSNKYLHESKLMTDINKLREQSGKYDVIVCGSDQIWAPNAFSPVYFAAFAKTGVRKVSYAASVGLNDIPDDIIPLYKQYLSDFYAISVREEEGRNILRNRCQIESSVVLDPTFLHDASFYSNIERKVKGITGKYLFCYFLNGKHQYSTNVKEYAQRHNLIIVGVSVNKNDSSYMKLLEHLGADQFIWLINHSEAIMTDSYHGTIFSLLFHKNVYTFQRFAENDAICQNSRIRQLQCYFGLHGHVVRADDVINESEQIDFDTFESQLGQLRKSSFDYLRKALQ